MDPLARAVPQSEISDPVSRLFLGKRKLRFLSQPLHPGLLDGGDWHLAVQPAAQRDSCSPGSGIDIVPQNIRWRTLSDRCRGLAGAWNSVRVPGLALDRRGARHRLVGRDRACSRGTRNTRDLLGIRTSGRVSGTDKPGVSSPALLPALALMAASFVVSRSAYKPELPRPITAEFEMIAAMRSAA